MAEIPDSIAEVLARGVATSAEIQRALDLSQPSVSRALAAMGDAIVRIGQRRAARYGLPLDIPGIGSTWPVFAVSETGEPELLGRLTSLYRDQYWFDAKQKDRSEVTDGLPFFLQDLRPQGFIGRTVPKRYPELGLPERITDWKDSDVLTYLVRRGDDGIGNILVGDESLQRFLKQARTPIQAIDIANRHIDYISLANAAIEGDVAGSSAGGEHPKFTCLLTREGISRHVLVKFSPAGADPVSQRWFDLLVSEHLAISALRVAGITSANTDLLPGDGQVFLETERFDRMGVVGRRGVVSLAAIDAYLIGKRQSWISTARSLRSLNRISNDDLERIRRVATYGRLIGNTDMHFGNLSFYLTFEGPFVLAPIYDMLPMMYAPTVANAIPNRELELPLPNADSLDIWRDMTMLAKRFWASTASHELISPGFRAIAHRNAEIVGQAADTGME
jgi:hypothetical protein